MIYYGNVSAKKSLGQNFLISSKIAKKIASIANCCNIVEIGPGKGMLTKFLLENDKKVYAIEKDLDLRDFLIEKFSKYMISGQLYIEFNDVLNVDIDSVFKDKNYCVVANIPYYITGAILKKIFEQKQLSKEVVLLVQKEVAQRIVDKKGSILSNSIKAYGTVRIVFNVSASNFYPTPKVDSSVIHISDISRNKFELFNIKEDKFFNILKKGFSSKRKKLSSNLAAFLNKEQIEDILVSIGHNKHARAEELDIYDWFNLVKAIESYPS